MKTYRNPFLILISVVFYMTACGHKDDHDHAEETEHHEQDERHYDEIHFSEQQFNALNMKVDTLPLKVISSYIQTNGQLEVPPQNEATVTAIIGANITDINVIEGDEVKKGQVLAYLSHPDLIAVQTDYSSNWNELNYLEKEYQRQQKLYEENVGSGKTFQKTQSEYLSIKGKVKGLEAQLKQMGLNLNHIREGNIYEQIPVRSPIKGSIRLVEVKIGQYVQPQTEMFEIIDSEHIHADLMVFEKDIHKVQKGQKVLFSVESLPGKELEAEIYAVGKAFEQHPKALHIHAEIENREGLLIPGMYVRGKIMADSIKSYALPQDAVIKEGDKTYIFTAIRELENDKTVWAFTPVEVVTGNKGDDWVEIKLTAPLSEESRVAWNNAYYLMAEMKKGEAAHSH